MMNINDVKKILMPIKQKIFLLIGRAILQAIDVTKKTTTIQVTGLANETISDVEKIDEFGFSSNPPIDGDSEVVIVFVNGNRDQGLALKVHHKSTKPTDLSEGDTRIYDNFGNQITLTSDGIEIQTGDALNWGPNVMKTCPLTGIPHGGVNAGIIKLKGK